MTCLLLLPISRMISAIFSAIRPLTPVSISSKMMVGSFTAPLIIALSESMMRAISPPEATCEIGCNGVLLLALNKNDTLSIPECEQSFDLKSMANFTLGMPSGTNRRFISSSTLTAAFLRSRLSVSANCMQWPYATFTACLSSSSRSVPPSIFCSSSAISSRFRISSSTLSTWNLRSNE